MGEDRGAQQTNLKGALDIIHSSNRPGDCIAMLWKVSTADLSHPPQHPVGGHIQSIEYRSHQAAKTPLCTPDLLERFFTRNYLEKIGTLYSPQKGDYMKVKSYFFLALPI